MRLANARALSLLVACFLVACIIAAVDAALKQENQGEYLGKRSIGRMGIIL